VVQWDSPHEDRAARFDSSRPHIARMYDYWLGGKNYYPADRDAAEQVIAALPDTRVSVRANRAFLNRAVHHLAADLGIRQFLDIGTGLPATGNTHEVAQQAAPDARIVYVDNDPIVLVHAEALLASDPRGATDYIEADVRDPATILNKAKGTLDFDRPIALMLVAILHCVPDQDDPETIVAALRDAVPSGSYLVLSHPALDIGEMAEVQQRQNEKMPADSQVTYRSLEQVTPYFADWELLEPGIVPTSQWRPGTGISPRPMPLWAGVARKP
jgi:hypothetical protein